MSWLGNIATRFKIGGTTGKSGGVAKERLSIILAHQRGDELMQKIDLEGLQHEVLELVKKYISVDASKPVQLSVKQEGPVDVFEMQVHLAGAAQGQRHRVVPPTS